MKLFAVKEQESRAALTPQSAKKFIDKGVEVAMESGLGEQSSFSDTAYTSVGVTIASREEGIKAADIVIRILAPSIAEIALMKKGAWHVSLLNPWANKEILEAFAKQDITAVSLEMMPRTTLAQKMDVISSQANLAGYMAVIKATDSFAGILPMMMTPAGTLSPAKVFVLGIGVAGLQAIATAKRLGARVTAFDVREEALEQAESLGAKALRIDLGETGSTDQGYAKQLTPEQIIKQQEAQAAVCIDSDIVITTAKVFGRKPPVLIKKEVVAQMKEGSVIADLAAEGGGNVEGVVADQVVTTDNGVTLIGYNKFENFVSRDASAMFASNIEHFFNHFWDKEAKVWQADVQIKGALEERDDILKSCVMTTGGAIVHEQFKA